MRILKWVARSGGIGILWVFILSLQWKGEPIYNPLSDFLVRNPLVSTLDQQLDEFIDKLEKAIKIAWQIPTEKVEKQL